MMKVNIYIYIYITSANYKLLKHLRMMSEPLSHQQNRFLKEAVSVEIQTCLSRLKNPSGLTKHSTNPLGKIKDKLCQQIA